MANGLAELLAGFALANPGWRSLHYPVFFPSMIPGADGLPMIARSARVLRVRVDGESRDIERTGDKLFLYFAAIAETFYAT